WRGALAPDSDPALLRAMDHPAHRQPAGGPAATPPDRRPWRPAGPPALPRQPARSGPLHGHGSRRPGSVPQTLSAAPDRDSDAAPAPLRRPGRNPDTETSRPETAALRLGWLPAPAAVQPASQRPRR